MKAFRNVSNFLKTYWALKRARSPERAAAALGRPDKLILSREQSLYVQELFCAPDSDPIKVFKGFSKRWPRTNFRYFMTLSDNGQALEYGDAEPFVDGMDIINAAMRELGAIIVNEKGEEIYNNEHPMVLRIAEAYRKQDIDDIVKARKKGGIAGAIFPDLDKMIAESKARRADILSTHQVSIDIDCQG